MPKYIQADQFFYPQGIRQGGYLELIDGKFGKLVQSVPQDAEVIDYSILCHSKRNSVIELASFYSCFLTPAFESLSFLDYIITLSFLFVNGIYLFLQKIVILN